MWDLKGKHEARVSIPQARRDPGAAGSSRMAQRAWPCPRSSLRVQLSS